jgi:hypothetical protein
LEADDKNHLNNIQQMESILGELLHSPASQDFRQFFALVRSMEDDKVAQPRPTSPLDSR